MTVGATKAVRREIAAYMAEELDLPEGFASHIRHYHRMPGNVDLPAVIVEADDDNGYHSYDPSEATYCGYSLKLTVWLCVPNRDNDGDFDLLDDWGDQARAVLDVLQLDAGGQVSVRGDQSPRPGTVGETPTKFIAIDISVA